MDFRADHSQNTWKSPPSHPHPLVEFRRNFGSPVSVGKHTPSSLPLQQHLPSKGDGVPISSGHLQNSHAACLACLAVSLPFGLTTSSFLTGSTALCECTPNPNLHTNLVSRFYRQLASCYFAGNFAVSGLATHSVTHASFAAGPRTQLHSSGQCSVTLILPTAAAYGGRFESSS